MKYITSRANAAVRRALALHNKKGRDKNGAFLIEGSILISEAAKAGLEIEQVFVRGGMAGMDIPCGASAIALPENIFDEIADTVTPKGVMAVAKKPDAAASDDIIGSASSVLVLDRLQDPGNVGTLVRTAFAAGMGAVACVRGTADVYSLKVVRAAAGALFRIPIVEFADAAHAATALSRAGFSLKALDMSGGKSYSVADLSGRVAIAVGNEGGGLSEGFLAAADEVVSIPMADGAESLNAAVAAGIV
ncbi:MAG: RNA methyltransferase, partial [Clostridiales Family XIII bacterium]|nr:RNA methyltransferase [Clostridiales Family XIII bacterium]